MYHLYMNMKAITHYETSFEQPTNMPYCQPSECTAQHFATSRNYVQPIQQSGSKTYPWHLSDTGVQVAITQVNTTHV